MLVACNHPEGIKGAQATAVVIFLTRNGKSIVEIKAYIERIDWIGVFVMDSDNISKNIRNLRIAYGETQMDLAYAIGLDSPAAIANYEKGTRTPKPDVRRKIAAHYLMTEDELVHGNYYGLNVVSFPFDDTVKMKEITKTFLPIICTDEALADPLFRKGYEAHMRIYKEMSAGEEIEERDFNICLDAYNESYESNNTLESAANCLWWLLLIGMGMANMRLLDGIEALEKKKVEKADFIKRYYLHNSDIDYYDEGEAQRKKERQEFLEDSEEIIVTLLRELKASPQWSDLVDYYTAFRYTICIVNNNLSDDMNRTVGREMMLAITTLGNKYANTFIRAVTDANKK